MCCLADKKLLGISARTQQWPCGGWDGWGCQCAERLRRPQQRGSEPHLGQRRASERRYLRAAVSRSVWPALGTLAQAWPGRLLGSSPRPQGLRSASPSVTGFSPAATPETGNRTSSTGAGRHQPLARSPSGLTAALQSSHSSPHSPQRRTDVRISGASFSWQGYDRTAADAAPSHTGVRLLMHYTW